MEEPKKKFTLSSTDKKIAGVCGGIAEYFDIDPTMFRLIYALATIFTTLPGIVIYIILWVIMPKQQ